MALLSVIVTVYNEEKYLEECLNSICSQIFEDFEIVCVNDGSTDGSQRILEHYSNIDDRVKVVYQENKGLVEARKTGVREAHGKYIGFVDADDWIEPEMYEEMVELMELYHTDLLSAGIIDSGNQKKLDCSEEGLYVDNGFDELISTLFYSDKHLQYRMYPNTVTKIYKRDILKETIIGIPSAVRYREDDCLTYSYLMRCTSVFVLRKAFYHYRYVANSHSRKWDERFFSHINDYYLFVRESFSRSAYNNVLLPQLDRYYAQTIVEAINKSNMTADSITEISFPVVGKRNVIVYGAGTYGQRMARRIMMSTNHVFICAIDRNYKQLSSLDYPVYSPDALKKMDFDVVLIALENKQICERIKEDLVALGIDVKKISIV